MLFELLFERRGETETENKVRRTDLLTGNVVLLSERVQVLDRSNYGCLLAASKNTVILLKHSLKMDSL